MADDLIIRNGLVVDGTGRPSFLGDVLLRSGRVEAVGLIPPTESIREIDATGKVVAPGFIDVHTHFDAQICWNPGLESISQYGVTTVVMGNCGIGVAPLRSGGADYLIQLLANVEGMSIAALQQGVSWSWSSYADYLDAIDRPSGVNLISLVGHSPLRHQVMGEDSYQRVASSAEIASMQSELRDALEAGAWGFSSSCGLTHSDLAGRPAPSRLAGREEFEGLADVVHDFPFGIIGMSPESKVRGLTEADTDLLIMLSKRGGASVNWNPLAYSPQLPSLSSVNLRACEAASEAGAEVYGVFNPSGVGGSRVDLDSLFLFAYMPHWQPLKVMSREDRIRAFQDPAVRAELADDLEHDTSMGLLTARLRTMWDILRITEAQAPENQQYVGRIVGDIARETGRTPFDTMLDIAVADGLRVTLMQEDPRNEDAGAVAAFRELAASPLTFYGGSDAGAHLDMLANESIPARTLSWRVREQGSLSLEETVRRFTAAIADGLGLPARGRLTPGYAADVVVFDLDTIGDGDAYVSYDLPGGDGRMMTNAQGISYTIVAGEIVFDHGRPSGNLPGRLLRATA